jgi:hypothetical protein
MSKSKANPAAAVSTDRPRTVAIVAKNQVIELWHIHRLRSSYKEREVHLPAEVRTRTVNGRREQCDIQRRHLAHQEWGQFMIRRYRVTRMIPWTPSMGLMMLIPQCALIGAGGLMALASGWRILTHRMQSTGGVPVETLGVSRHALGLPNDALVAESLPGGYRASHFKGQLEVDAPVGPWIVVEELTSDLGWHRAR